MSQILFLLIFCQTFTSCLFELKHLPDYDRVVRQSLTECVVNAATRFFKAGESIFYSLPLCEVESTDPPSAVLDRLMLAALTQECKWSLFVKNVSFSDHSRGQVVHKPTHYIIQLRNQTEFLKNIDTLKHYNNWNPLAKFLIIAPVSENPRKLATVIMKKLWEVHVVNGVVLLPDRWDTTVFNAYTWFPYQQGNCGDDFDKVVLIDSCSFGNSTQFVNWYPDKIPKKFNQCPVKVRMVEWPPYIIGVPNGTWSNSTNNSNRGIEVNLLDLIAEIFDLRMFYYYSDAPLNWGEIYENGTATGNMKYLLDEIDDISIGCYGKTTRRAIFFQDTFYLSDSLVFCVPYSSYGLRFESMFRIMKPGAFVLTLFIYSILTGLMWLTSSNDWTCYQNLDNCMINTLCTLLGLPVSHRPKSEKVRIFMAMLMVYSFCLITAYQTLLDSALTDVSNKQRITTVKDVIDRGMDIYGVATTSRYFATDGSNPRTNKVNGAILKRWKNCNNIRKCLDYVAFRRDTAVCLSRLFTEYMINSYKTKKKDPLIHCFEKSVVSLPISILMRKGFQLYERFNLFIARIVASGFILKWERDILRIRYENLTSAGVDVTSHDTTTHLDFNSLKPLFFLWSIGCGSALIAFLFEIIFYKWTTITKLCFA
ncbi:hypothetical protein MTP99_003385 [Tenebrio molitor]|jgi:hypothetical protein|nr:hypothetical protein MTP99_003385 [Tenebrio molitor]